MPRSKPFKDLAREAKSVPHRKARIAEYRRAIDDSLALARLRQECNLTQTEVADRLGVSQSNISQIEHEPNIYLATLRRYVEVLGGELEVTAVFDDKRIKL